MHEADPSPAPAAWPDDAIAVAADLPVAAGEIIRLSPRAWRITAPNPGMMTGPGTNSYLLIGEDSCACVDPGPADPAHTTALLAAVAASGRPLRHILLTHTHRDHSPGCQALVDATGARVLGMAPLADDPSQDRDTRIDTTLTDGEVWTGLGWPLHVLHTPGHVENHLCYHDPAEGWLLTGDHLIQGSTVVIIPPHGRLADYLRSLEKLLPLAPRALLPGHGRLIADAGGVVRGTIAHRLQREAKVIARLREAGPTTLADLVPLVYDDVPPLLHPVARYSLWAHLIKLAGEGRVDCLSDEIWQMREVGTIN